MKQPAVKRSTKQRASESKQDRAERAATAIRMHGAGATYRQIAETLGCSPATVMRLVRDAPAATVEAAARDHARVVQERIDAVWKAQADNLADPKAAAAALRAAELEARMFLPAPGVGQKVPVGGLTVVVDPHLISPPTISPDDTLESYNAACDEQGRPDWRYGTPDRPSPFPLPRPDRSTPLRSVG